MLLRLQQFSAHKISSLALILVGGVSLGISSAHAAQPQTAASDKDAEAFFQQKIQPVLSERCYDCHSANSRSAGGLRLDDREALLKGGKNGPAIVPGNPDGSLLMQRLLLTNEKKRMPKDDDPLSEKEIADLRAWIANGAKWSESAASTAAPAVFQKASISTSRIPYPRPATQDQLAFFEKNVRPILVNRCYNCHSQNFKEAGGLRVDVGIAIFKGGKDGPVIVPGHPEKSLLIERVKSSDSKKRMPQESDEALPANEIALLESWIKDGAAWPDETEKLPPTPERLQRRYPKLRAEWWSWQPLTQPSVPQLAGDSWFKSNIDRFLLADLHAKKLEPVADATPDTLLRRLRYDLTGLPPTPEEIRAFRSDHSEKAYETLVDTLLASQQFGERWGRHWLDIARYAESSGPSRNMPYPNAWRYRDYVIDAFNRDLPLNRFLTEQIAGDLLPAATPADRDRLLIATGFLALGPKDVNQRFSARFKMDGVDDEIDTVTRSTMALTASCARCHDHKFDPIPTTDYYALAGIFTSTEDDAGLRSLMGGSSLAYYDPKHLGYINSTTHPPDIPQEQRDKLKAQVADAKKQLDDWNAQHTPSKKNNAAPPPLSANEKHHQLELQHNLVQLKEEQTLLGDLGELGYGIHSVREGEIADTAVRVRGVEERHGPTVPRGFLSIVRLSNTPQIPEGHSGRLELAEWITNPQNPLTARVYANRVWQHLFGTGLVSTVDNFGSMGDTPSNPALLDYLAHDFMDNGWSTKKLVREIVLTHAYRLGNNTPTGYQDIDPANRLVWRHSPRRLESEEIRDSILASAGSLDGSHPHGSSTMNLRMIEIRDDGPVVESVLDSADRSRYRSVYLPLLRDEVPRPLTAFDPVSQTLVTGRREETTVPSQALFMLNSPFVRQQAEYLSNLLLSTPESDDKRIRTAFLRVLGHEPTVQDTQKVRAFLASYTSAWKEPGSSAAHLEKTAAEVKPLSLTDGIFREDGLTQDDDVEADKSQKSNQADQQPGSAKNAAWTAFIQALYGSAAFQFVR